jgi:HTH-type transcriptional regulator, sugar sensing transcriptional regulator
MLHQQQLELERLGLSTPEAQIYLALLRHGRPLGASVLAATTAISRSNVYLTLNSLLDRGLIEAEAGYGSRFSAVPPEQALPALIVRKNNELLECKRRADELVKELEPLAKPAHDTSEAEVIQVLRDPRVITERFERLHFEAERQIEVCVKAPFFLGSTSNPAQEEALRRGVRGRGLYERAILDAPEVRPFLETWVAKGEEARIYNGELPHKLAIFDRQTVLLPLFMPGNQVRTLFVRHQPLAISLGMLFDSLWERSEPIFARKRKKQPGFRKDSASDSERDGAMHNLVPLTRRKAKGAAASTKRTEGPTK